MGRSDIAFQVRLQQSERNSNKTESYALQLSTRPPVVHQALCGTAGGARGYTLDAPWL
jgi:hypothetical protein